MSIENAEFRLSQGLQKLSSAISVTEADTIAKGFFPQLDSVIKSDSRKLNDIVDVTLNAAKSLFDARSALGLDSKSGILLLRETAKRALGGTEIKDEAFAGIDYAIKPRPPEPLAGLVDANITDHGEHVAIAQAQGDDSAELSKSKLLAEIFNPITEVMLKLNPAQQKNFLDQLSDIFKSNKGEQGNVAPEALIDVKEKIAVLIKDYNPQALKEFVTNLDPAIKFELSSFFEQILKPGLEGGEMLLKAGAEINNKFKPALVKILESRIRANPGFETPSSEADLERIQVKKDFVMYKVIEMSKDLEAKLKQSPTYDVEAYFQRGLDSLETQLGSKGEKLYASDLSLLSSHLKATKTVSQDKQQLDVATFLQKHSKMALMALPMILGPIASVLSMIPVIGKPLARLAPVVNNFATQFGPYMFMMFMNKGGGDKSSNPVEKAKDPDETPYVDLNQFQTAA